MRAKRKNFLLAIVVSAIAIFLPAWILNKWIEGIVFFICHWLIREQFPKQYHHIIPSVCRVITGTTFFFGVSFILPFGLSLLSAVPINYFIGWIGFTKKQADTFEHEYFKLKVLLENQSKFDVSFCTETELRDRCRKVGLSQENTELAVELFIYKIKQKDIAKRLCIEEKSIQQKKRRLKEKLNKQ